MTDPSESHSFKSFVSMHHSGFHGNQKKTNLRNIPIRNYSALHCLREHFKNLLLQKYSAGFPSNFAGMFLCWPSIRKEWPPVGGSVYSDMALVKTLKICFSKSIRPISNSFCRNASWVASYQTLQSNVDLSKNMSTRRRCCLALEKTFKIFFIENIWPISK